MPTLHLGVLDVAYSDANGGDPSTTTGKVAEELEKRYSIMETFYESRKQVIADYLAESMADSLHDLIKRGRGIAASGSVTTRRVKNYGETAQRVLTSTQSSLTYDADQKIERDFRKFIFANEMQKMSITPWLPMSEAAAEGVNHRKKHPYARKNRARPNFVDTGLYVASFRAWTNR